MMTMKGGWRPERKGGAGRVADVAAEGVEWLGGLSGLDPARVAASPQRRCFWVHWQGVHCLTGLSEG